MAEPTTYLVTGALAFRGVQPGGTITARLSESAEARHVRAKHISRIDDPPPPPFAAFERTVVAPDPATDPDGSPDSTPSPDLTFADGEHETPGSES